MEYIYTIFIILLVCLILINLYYSCNQNNNNITETTKLNNNNIIQKLLENKQKTVYVVDANNINWLLLNKAINICNKNKIGLIIKNGLKYFPKLKNFNKEHINKYYNTDNKKHLDKTITVDKNPLNYLDSNYLETIKKNNDSFLFRREKLNLNNTSRNITNELTFPNPIFKKNDLISYIFYNGYKNTGVMPHAHGLSINLLVKGSKKWLFLNEEQNSLLYNTYETINQSKINYIDWYNKYIKSDINSKYIEFIQNSRDIVIVPYDITHSVLNIEDSIGMVLDL